MTRGGSGLLCHSVTHLVYNKFMSGRLHESGSLFYICECALNLIFSVQEFISKARRKESRKI